MYCLSQVICCVHTTNIECTVALFAQCHNVLIEDVTDVTIRRLCKLFVTAPWKPVRTEKVNTMHDKVYQDVSQGLII